MLGLCHNSVAKGYRHFLYGGRPGIAEKLKAELIHRYPGLQIAGTYTPPLPTPYAGRRSRSVFASAGLGRECALVWTRNTEAGTIHGRLSGSPARPVDDRGGRRIRYFEWNNARSSGMGSANWTDFDFPSVSGAAALWKRYLLNNPRFMWLTFLQLSGIRRFELD